MTQFSFYSINLRLSTVPQFRAVRLQKQNEVELICRNVYSEGRVLCIIYEI